MIRIILALSLVAACGPIAPQASAPVARGKHVKCKQVQMTGSLMSRSLCMTEDDETEIREAHQRAVREKETGYATKSN